LIHELEFEKFGIVKSLFEGHKQYLPVLAIIEGNFPGRVFVDDLSDPSTTLVWAVSRWAYIEGDPGNPEFSQSIGKLLQGTIVPDSLRINQHWFELYARNSEDWIATVENWLEKFGSIKHYETVYRWDRDKYRRFRRGYIFPVGAATQRADIPILRSSLPPAPFIAKRFLARRSISYRVMVQDRVVSQCRSNGFSVGPEFMIDVETFGEDDRGKGYATAAGVALLDHCRETGLVPLWETTEHNTASQRLAEKLGFVTDETYPVYAIEF